MNEEIIKKCPTCKQNKNINMFYKNKSRKDGHNSQCKECIKRYTISNKDRISKYKKQWSLTNADNISNRMKKYYQLNRLEIIKKNKAYSILNKVDIANKTKKYYHKNKNIITDYNRKYYINNKDYICKNNMEYAKTNIGKSVVLNARHKRRAIIRIGNVNSYDILKLQQTAKVCYWCKLSLKNLKVHIDHYIPLAKGGEHTLSNLVVSCDKCNMRKHAKDPIVFAQSIGRLL